MLETLVVVGVCSSNPGELPWLHVNWLCKGTRSNLRKKVATMKRNKRERNRVESVKRGFEGLRQLLQGKFSKVCLFPIIYLA